MNDRTKLKMSRRDMLKLVAVSTAGATLAACTPAAVPTTAPAAASTATIVPTAVTLKLEEGNLVCLLCCGTDETHALQEKFNTYFSTTYPGIKTSLELTPGGQNYFE